MKSIGLALTIFGLTGALAALDLSGAARAPLTSSEVAQTTKAVLASRAVASDVTNADQEAADDEADAEIVRAFLVTPRSLVPKQVGPVDTLRYD